MANSEYEYVRKFEQWDALPPSNWIVVRIDGRGFSKLTRKHAFTKPNDERGLKLMNAAARQVVSALSDIVLAYGQSDEYSFVFGETSTLFERRASKLATTVAATFTAEYVLQWPDFFPEAVLTRPFPSFDARCVAYPKARVLRDYLCWRQADCHVNNLYNTTFWALVLKGGMGNAQAEEALKGTLASDKNEILWKRFGINYNNEEEMFRKGTVVYRSYDDDGLSASRGKTASTGEVHGEAKLSKTQMEKERKRKQKATIVSEHRDIIGEAFWTEHPYILGGKRGYREDE